MNREQKDNHGLKTRIVAILTGATIFLVILGVAVLLNQVTALVAAHQLLPAWAIGCFHLLEGLMVVVDCLGLAWVVTKHLMEELSLDKLKEWFNRD